MPYEAIVIGVSSGGMNAMKVIFSYLPRNFKIPVIIVQHISARSDKKWITILNDTFKINIKEADEKEKIEQGTVYIAPPNYHLLIERNKTFSLTIDERVNFARPSIDVLFESAADAYKDKLIGVVLTGSNNDGAKGIRTINEFGGLTIIQDPKTAESAYMPEAAISAIKPDYILPLKDIAQMLVKLGKHEN